MVSLASSSQHFQHQSSKLRTYVVLTAKSSTASPTRRARLASVCSLSSSTSSTSSTASEDEDEDDDEELQCQHQQLSSYHTSSPSDPTALDYSMAYESYAAVTSRYNNAGASRGGASPRELRWSDLNRSSGPRGPRIELSKFLSTKSSQNARKRQLKKNASNGGANAGANANQNQDNELLEMHTLELCLEFLDLDDLVNGTLVCSEFRHVITSNKRLLLALYSQKWRSSPTANVVSLGGAYLNAPFPSQLAMCRERNASQMMQYPLATRSSVTQNAVDGTYKIHNNSMLRSFARGSVDSFRGTQALPVLPCAKALQKQISYFEVSMKGCGSVGIASLSDEASKNAYGFGSEEHLGWKPVSYGYHGNDGDFVYNDGSASYGGEWTPFGPAWGGVDAQSDEDAATFIVGCGLNHASSQLFFTLNGTLVGTAPVAILKGEYAAAVSLHSYGDAATLNVGSAPFRFDIEGFCASPYVLLRTYDVRDVSDGELLSLNDASFTSASATQFRSVRNPLQLPDRSPPFFAWEKDHQTASPPHLLAQAHAASWQRPTFRGERSQCTFGSSWCQRFRISPPAAKERFQVRARAFEACADDESDKMDIKEEIVRGVIDEMIKRVAERLLEGTSFCLQDDGTLFITELPNDTHVKVHGEVAYQLSAYAYANGLDFEIGGKYDFSPVRQPVFTLFTLVMIRMVDRASRFW